MITPASFKIRFPEFVSEKDARVQLFIDDTVLLMNTVSWGAKYDLGQSYMTAHFLAVGNDSEAGNDAGTGPIAAKSVDGASVSFGGSVAKNQWESSYATTVYGQRYLALVKTLGIAALVI